MFSFSSLFEWRKASVCESVLKELRYCLVLLMNKTFANSAYLRHDIAHSLCTGERTRALDRAQQLLLDDNLISLYTLLIKFSDFILRNFSYVRKHRELLDVGINQAVSTIVFASAQFGVDLPELCTLRLLFEKRYGKSFVETALNLLPGNCVSAEMTAKLSKVSISNDAKSKLLGEIAALHGLRLEVLALDYTPEFNKNVTEEEKNVMEGEESRSKASSKQRKVCDEDDCIEEDQRD